MNIDKIWVMEMFDFKSNKAIFNKFFIRHFLFAFLSQLYANVNISN